MKGVDGNILKTCEPSREACFPIIREKSPDYSGKKNPKNKLPTTKLECQL